MNSLLLRNLALLSSVTLLAWGTLVSTAYADERSLGISFDSLTALGAEEMESARGKEGFVNLTKVQSIQDMDATVNNSAFIIGGDLVTGAVNVDSNAFNNYSGAGVFNITTGNANAINGAIGISVYITSPD